MLITVDGHMVGFIILSFFFFFICLKFSTIKSFKKQSLMKGGSASPSFLPFFSYFPLSLPPSLPFCLPACLPSFLFLGAWRCTARSGTCVPGEKAQQGSSIQKLSLLWWGTMSMQVDTGQTLYDNPHLLFPSGLGGQSWDSPFLNLEQ